MGKIEPKIGFDRPVRRIGAYSYDLVTRICEEESVQPMGQSSGESSVLDYTWSIQNPANDRLCFIVYEH